MRELYEVETGDIAGNKKIGFYLHKIYICLGLENKLMNKNIEI